MILSNSMKISFLALKFEDEQTTRTQTQTHTQNNIVRSNFTNNLFQTTTQDDMQVR